jgi:hypothetical protein
VHGDATVTIDGGAITILDSYEGIESAIIDINGATIDIVSSDDGINIAGGNDGSGAGPGGRAGPGAQDTFSDSGDYLLTITGGTITIDAGGDGIDANGSVVMSGGTVVIQGPTAQNNGALDYDGGFELTGGTLVAAGSAGMAQSPQSDQATISIRFGSTIAAGTMIQIQTSDGTPVATFQAAKAVQSLVFSSPELNDGASYQVLVGGDASGDSIGGLIQTTESTGGELAGTVTA